MAEIKIKVHGKTADIYTPYSAEFVSRVKTIKGRKWNAEKKCWSIPASAIDTCRKIMNDVYGESDLGLTAKKADELRRAAEEEAVKREEAKAAEAAKRKEQRAAFARGDRVTDGFTGTEKQIAWAERVIEEARPAVDRAFDDLMAHYEAMSPATKSWLSYEIDSAKRGYKNVRCYLDHMQSAPCIIDNRKKLSPEYYRDPDCCQIALDNERFQGYRLEQAACFFKDWKDGDIDHFSTVLWFRDKKARGYDVYIKEESSK